MTDGSGASTVDVATSDEAPTLARQLAGVAGYVSQPRLPRGDKAELRRLRPDERHVPPEVFWRLVDRYEIPERDEPFWLAIIPSMVRHPHQPGRRPGAALAESGVKAPRVERWLRHDREGALGELERLLSQLDGSIDWVRLGTLLYWWNHAEYGPEHKRRLARHYFLSPARRTTTRDGGDG